MMGLRFNPDRHIVMEVPLSGWLRREFPNRPLFIYRHTQSGNFVIAEWCSPAKTMAMEHHLLGPNPRNFTKEDAITLRGYLTNPISVDMMLELAKRGEHEIDEQSMIDQEDVWLKPRYDGLPGHRKKATMLVPSL